MMAFFGRFDFTKIISRKCIPCGIMQAKETLFSIKRKVVKNNYNMASKQQFLPEKLSKFNSTLHSSSLIECQIIHIVMKILRAVFALPPQTNGALQNYSMLRPGYRILRFLDTKCTVCIHRTYCHSISAGTNGQHWILSFKKTHHHGNDCKMNG